MHPKTDSTDYPTKTADAKNAEDTNVYSYPQQAHIMYRCTANLNVGLCCLSVGP